MKLRTRTDYRRERHARIRRKLTGTPERPRLSIMMSNRHIHVQFIDDSVARTLASVTTSGSESTQRNKVAASRLGELAAKTAREKGIRQVVVDRGGHRFHGCVRALVEAMVKAGVSARSDEKESKQ